MQPWAASVSSPNHPKVLLWLSGVETQSLCSEARQPGSHLLPERDLGQLSALCSVFSLVRWRWEQSSPLSSSVPGK